MVSGIDGLVSGKEHLISVLIEPCNTPDPLEGSVKALIRCCLAVTIKTGRNGRRKVGEVFLAATIKTGI